MSKNSLLLDNGKVLESELLKLLDTEVEKSSINIDANYISSITYILDKLRKNNSVSEEYSLENFVVRFNSKYGTHLKVHLSENNKIIKSIILIVSFIAFMLGVIFTLNRFLIKLVEKCPLRL
ncbi:hypothetical protein IMSAGC011_01447 [Lachnospiraceae bacterium]|nr:hypothetical protein IMSAGC011_01447 [Lachnospiraceae bacterium]